MSKVKVGQIWKIKDKYDPQPDIAVPFVITKIEKNQNGAMVCWFQRFNRDNIENTFGTAIIVSCELLSDV